VRVRTYRGTFLGLRAKKDARLGAEKERGETAKKAANAKSGYGW